MTKKRDSAIRIIPEIPGIPNEICVECGKSLQISTYIGHSHKKPICYECYRKKIKGKKNIYREYHLSGQ